MVDRVKSVCFRKSVRRAKKHDGFFEDMYSDRIKKSKEVIILDVGGEKFHVLKSIFSPWPTTRLSRLVRAETMQERLSFCDGYYPSYRTAENKREYFFNRNWSNFNCILDLYRRGRLHCNKSACAMTFQDDLEYWGINDLFLDPCCALDYFVEKDTGEKEHEGEMMNRKHLAQRFKDEEFGDSNLGRIRTFLWNMTEYPETSGWARVRWLRIMSIF